MKLAILGASSRIAADFILGLSSEQASNVTLFARDPNRVSSMTGWPPAKVFPYADFGPHLAFDGILNFVGQSTPESRSTVSNDIRQVNRNFDNLALTYLDYHPNTRYVYLSSGAALGAQFSEPAKTGSPYQTENLDEYSMAKQESELGHRQMAHQNIIDLRIFSYFHRTQSQESRFLLSNIVRAIRTGEILEIESVNIWRDFLGAADFSQLMFASLTTSLRNATIDAFTAAPISKFELLDICAAQFKLKYVIKQESSRSGPGKEKYYSEARSELLDYKPTQSSLENVLTEIGAILKTE